MTIDDLTWTSLVQLEPRLQELYDEALATKAPATIDPDDPWFGPEGIRERLSSLVGPLAPADRDPLLRTWKAYSIAQRQLLRAYI